MQTWKCTNWQEAKSANGHFLFNRMNRDVVEWAIADQSILDVDGSASGGVSPDRSSDGLLTIDPSRAMKIEMLAIMGQASIIIRVPVFHHRENRKHWVVCDVAQAARLANLAYDLKMPLELSKPLRGLYEAIQPYLEI